MMISFRREEIIGTVTKPYFIILTPNEHNNYYSFIAEDEEGKIYLTENRNDAIKFPFRTKTESITKNMPENEKTRIKEDRTFSTESQVKRDVLEYVKRKKIEKYKIVDSSVVERAYRHILQK